MEASVTISKPKIEFIIIPGIVSKGNASSEPVSDVSGAMKPIWWLEICTHDRLWHVKLELKGAHRWQLNNWMIALHSGLPHGSSKTKDRILGEVLRGTLSYNKPLNCIYNLPTIDCENPHWCGIRPPETGNCRKAYLSLLGIEDLCFLAGAPNLPPGSRISSRGRWMVQRKDLQCVSESTISRIPYTPDMKWAKIYSNRRCKHSTTQSPDVFGVEVTSWPLHEAWLKEVAYVSKYFC